MDGSLLNDISPLPSRKKTFQFVRSQASFFFPSPAAGAGERQKEENKRNTKQFIPPIPAPNKEGEKRGPGNEVQNIYFPCRRRQVISPHVAACGIDCLFVWLRPSKKKKNMFLVRISIKKKRRAGGFFCYLLFPIACFLYTLLPSPRDTLELLGQILIRRNIRYWLNTSLLNFDTHKGLTVKIYIILVCTQQQWVLHIFDVIRTPS